MKELRKLDYELSICKLAAMKSINWRARFVHLSKTGEEYSLVCPSGSEPADAIAVEAGWVALKLPGSAEFSLVRIIADILDRLERNEIGLFAISTFNTDYILLRAREYDKAADVLGAAGYAIN